MADPDGCGGINGPNRCGGSGCDVDSTPTKSVDLAELSRLAESLHPVLIGKIRPGPPVVTRCHVLICKTDWYAGAGGVCGFATRADAIA
ncbi:hypothetical protein V7x_07540 [Crateriforma conspicua]|uniref:Uncharacterized protein n=1 Tax=Crateriforma conspicua TaxID=2527996 RepID=A0A5C6FUP5_9PLAN|nr:hypothetical protein V7x_07540 [Crateriforma conspicua]